MAISEGERKHIMGECTHHQIGGESVLKALEFAEQHGVQNVIDVLEQMHIVERKKDEGTYTQFYRLLTEKVGPLIQTPESARHQERQDNLKYKYGKNEEDVQRAENLTRYMESRKRPLSIFYGFEKNGGREAAIRQQKMWGKEPDKKLVAYWRENGYLELLEHYGLVKPEVKEEE